MTAAQHFSVQTCLGTQDETEFTECVHIDALCPRDAAEKVLKEPLSVVGTIDRIRAKVWHLGDDFQPVSTLVYAP